MASEQCVVLLFSIQTNYEIRKQARLVELRKFDAARNDAFADAESGVEHYISMTVASSADH